MKRIFVLFFLLPAAGNFLSAQSNEIQVPEKDLIYYRNKIDSFPYLIRAGYMGHYNLLCGLPGHDQYRNDSAGIDFTDMALQVTGRAKTAFIRMHVIKNKADLFYRSKDYQNALLYWQHALDIAIANHFACEELHNLRPAINNIFFLAGDYTDAMKMSSEGLSRAVKIHDKEMMLNFNNALGYIMMSLKNFEESKNYYEAGLALTRELKDNTLEGNALLNLSDLYVAEKKLPAAIQKITEALYIFQNKTLPGHDPADRQAYAYNKMAEAKKILNDLREALRYGLLAVETSRKAHTNFYDLARYNITTGDIYNRLHIPDSALLYLWVGLDTALHIRHREHTRDAYKQISIAYAQLGKFDSAFRYQDLSVQLQDSISNENNQIEVLEKQTNLQIEKQKALQEAVLEKQKTWRNIVIGIALFIIFLLGFLYNRYRLRQKNIYQKELNRQQNELFNAIAVTQDQERKRIAEDIHDSLGSILSAAKLKLSALKDEQQSPTAEQSENWKLTLQLLDEASSELRNISHNIMPATLSKLGLVAALKNLIDTISSHSGMQFNFSSYDLEDRITENTEMSIYRIVLELINNIVKHAGATKATVQLIRHPGYINLSVEDNGQGFNYIDALQAKKGIGLGNIASRVGYLKGKIEVDSKPGRGTTVLIDIPYATV